MRSAYVAAGVRPVGEVTHNGLMSRPYLDPSPLPGPDQWADEDLVGAIERQASERASRDGTTLVVSPESVSGSVSFSPELAARLAGPRGWPVIPTAAGHDAGILSAAGIPTAMLFVRNPTGVSHSPLETASMDDCLAGVAALADVLAELAGEPV